VICHFFVSASDIEATSPPPFVNEDWIGIKWKLPQANNIPLEVGTGEHFLKPMIEFN
jgi:hypothetical protein